MVQSNYDLQGNRKKIADLIDAEEHEFEYGGSEDANGTLTAGSPEFDKLKTEILKALDAEIEQLSNIIHLLCTEDITIEKACEDQNVPVSYAVNHYPILWVLSDRLEK